DAFPSLLGRIHRSRYLFATIVAAVALGALRHAIADRAFDSRDIARFLGDEPRIVTLTGRLIADPRIIDPPSDAPRAYESPPRTRFLLEADAIDGLNGPLSATGRLSCTIKEPLLGMKRGTRIRATGWLFAI